MKGKEQLLRSLNEATALHQGGDLAKAQAIYQSILLNYPNQPDALARLGTLHIQRAEFEDAVRLLSASLTVKPSQPDICNNLGHALRQLGRNDEALAQFEQACALAPSFADAHFNRGIVLLQVRRFAQAQAAFEAVLQHNASHPAAHNHRGIALWEQGLATEAAACYSRAIELAPGYADAYNNRAVLLMAQRHFSAAAADFYLALSYNPDTPYALGNWLYCKMQVCDWQDADQGLALLAQGIHDGKRVATPMTVLALPLQPQLLTRCASIYAQHMFPASAPLWNGERYNHRKTRIAYVSADFCEHALSFLMAGVFEQHDREQFEIIGVALSPPDGSATSARVHAAFDTLIDASGMSDTQVSAALRELEVDIAVDLMGFTARCRSAIFASRPAPVQVNYLGYPGSMGVPWIDYIIADRFVVPAHFAGLYSEKIVRLNGCFQANDDKRAPAAAPQPRAHYGLPENAMVFCAFNASYKILPQFMDIWGRLLQKVPGSVLWLVGCPDTQRNLQAQAQARGIDPQRLLFAARAAYQEHVSRLQHADLFLDTLPFNAGATASDSLWAGVPMVTCAGQAFAGRMAGSLLNALGMPSLVTATLEEYEALALRLSSNREELSALRAALAHNRQQSTLFDTAAFTRQLETAFRQMLARARLGLPPDHIDLDIVPEA